MWRRYKDSGDTHAPDLSLYGDRPLHEKAHGSEVSGGAAPKMHRRKAGGGGS